jgi:hypothetical protein
MSKYLLTQSLLSSYDWIFKKEDGLDDFMKTLNREPVQPTYDMLNGNPFENMVTAYSQGADIDPSHKWARGVRQVGDIVKGGMFQISLSKTAVIRNVEFVLYGRLDVLKAGIIYDIKFSQRYEYGKFLDNPQHPMYLELCPNADKFTYLVSGGDEMFTETCRREDIEPISREIEGFMSYMDEQGLTDMYCRLWESKY